MILVNLAIVKEKFLFGSRELKEIGPNYLASAYNYEVMLHLKGNSLTVVE